MKTKLIVALMVFTITASQVAFTSERSIPEDSPSPIAIPPASADDAHVPEDLLAITPMVPLGPLDLLRSYESEMASIAERLATELGAISNAVGAGQISREQGEYVTGERYRVAMMQFQLFSALREMLEADIARNPAVRTDSTPSPAGEIVVVPMPFSSFQLAPSLVEYLSLTEKQVRSIQRLIEEGRSTTQPLMDKLRTVNVELLAVSQSRDDEGVARRLGNTQARLLTQLMKANLRLQKRINNVLDPRQRKKLDCFRRTNEVTVGKAN
ncbi:MAG: hypothetical protein JWM08_1278 [Candidatus Angelobacter sp.]|nr:hypothetical protein [Candidatus Angelobacter sp.]